MTKVMYAEKCPTCFNPPSRPYRSHDKSGKIVQGCVDHFHTGHLVTASESALWHNRPAAKKLRADQKKFRHGYVT